MAPLCGQPGLWTFSDTDNPSRLCVSLPRPSSCSSPLPFILPAPWSLSRRKDSPFFEFCQGLRQLVQLVSLEIKVPSRLHPFRIVRECAAFLLLNFLTSLNCQSSKMMA